MIRGRVFCNRHEFILNPSLNAYARLEWSSETYSILGGGPLIIYSTYSNHHQYTTLNKAYMVCIVTIHILRVSINREDIDVPTSGLVDVRLEWEYWKELFPNRRYRHRLPEITSQVIFIMIGKPIVTPMRLYPTPNIYNMCKICTSRERELYIARPTELASKIHWPRFSKASHPRSTALIATTVSRKIDRASAEARTYTHCLQKISSMIPGRE